MSKPSLSLWINGRRTPSASSRVADVTNPASGEVIRQVPLANRADVDSAVAAAKAAFPDWRDTPPLRRSRILNKFRELLETHREELAQLASEEHGKTLEDAAGSVQRGIEVVEFAVGAPHLLKGEHAENVGRGVDCHSDAATDRRMRRHHAVQFSRDGADVDVPDRHRLRQHLRAQAFGESAVVQPAHGGIVQGSRVAGRRVQRRAGRQGSGRRLARASRRACACLSSVRRLSRNISTRPPRITASACRRWAARRTMRWCCPMLHWILPPMRIMGAAYGSAGERCMAISAVVAVGDVGRCTGGQAQGAGPRNWWSAPATAKAWTWAR